MMRKEDLQYRGKTVEDGQEHYYLAHIKEGGGCPDCHSKEYLVNDWITRKVYGMDKAGNRIIYEVECPRYRCRKCDKTWLEELTPRGIKYDKSITESLVEDYVENGYSYSNIKDKYATSVNSTREILADHFRGCEERKAYRIPELLGIERLSLKGERLFALIDVAGLSLLDLLTEEELRKLETEASPKEVMITDGEIADIVSEVFPEARHFCHDYYLFDKGLAVLLEEGERRGFDRNELIRYLENPNNPKTGRRMMKSPEDSVPLMLAYSYLRDNIDDTEKLRKYSGDIEAFRKFCQGLPAEKLPEKLEGFLLDEYIAGIRTLKDEADCYVFKRYQADSIRNLLLYNEATHYPSGEGDSFGRELTERKVVQQTGGRR